MNRDALENLTAEFNAQYSTLPALTLLDAMITNQFKGTIAQVSSFGTEAALLLALVAEVDNTTPVIFLDTLKHFPETLAYRDKLIHLLDLKDVRVIKPDPSALSAADPDGTMYHTNTDGCCHLRKVVPQEEALTTFNALINGRKRIHGGARAHLPVFEHDGRRIKINAIVNWTKEQIDTEWKRRNLPEHPLVSFGYFSVGCDTPLCTAKSDPKDSSARSGRWAGLGKTECGIHYRPAAALDISGDI